MVCFFTFKETYVIIASLKKGGIVLNKRQDFSAKTDGINNNTYNLLFSDCKNLPDSEKGSKLDLIRFILIDFYTRDDELPDKFYINNDPDTLYDVRFDNIKFDEKNNIFVYEDAFVSIPFDFISRRIRNPFFIKDLRTSNRYGNCHMGSINLSKIIPNSEVVTGYITMGNEKALHSVVEVSISNIPHILDWTRNLIMEKENYKRITRFEELTRFKADEYYDDLNDLMNLGFDSSKPYVCFREELKKDLEKNKTLFRK